MHEESKGAEFQAQSKRHHFHFGSEDHVVFKTKQAPPFRFRGPCLEPALASSPVQSEAKMPKKRKHEQSEDENSRVKRKRTSDVDSSPAQTDLMLSDDDTFPPRSPYKPEDLCNIFISFSPAPEEAETPSVKASESMEYFNTCFLIPLIGFPFSAYEANEEMEIEPLGVSEEIENEPIEANEEIEANNTGAAANVSDVHQFPSSDIRHDLSPPRPKPSEATAPEETANTNVRIGSKVFDYRRDLNVPRPIPFSPHEESDEEDDRRPFDEISANQNPPRPKPSEATAPEETANTNVRIGSKVFDYRRVPIWKRPIPFSPHEESDEEDDRRPFDEISANENPPRPKPSEATAPEETANTNVRIGSKVFDYRRVPIWKRPIPFSPHEESDEEDDRRPFDEISANENPPSESEEEDDAQEDDVISLSSDEEDEDEDQFIPSDDEESEPEQDTQVLSSDEEDEDEDQFIPYDDEESEPEQDTQVLSSDEEDEDEDQFIPSDDEESETEQVVPRFMTDRQYKLLFIAIKDNKRNGRISWKGVEKHYCFKILQEERPNDTTQHFQLKYNQMLRSNNERYQNLMAEI
ncbi:predicted protein [Chaetoceros tenuissimus]|uniref:Uncharacterized protein n=1 Tax=Chaetoceros tenuissimus TaxID=426638 RepID=A0AAD3HA32_9STRA|nr:predicted protein [Chaetoceros tenuissimus]